MAAPGLRAEARDGLRARVLAVVRDRQVSRADLTRCLGLPKSTLAAVVGELLTDGLLVERPGRPGGSGSGSGRPAHVLAPAAPAGVVTGLDFGHRHVRVALADPAGRVLSEDAVEVDVDQRAREALCRTVGRVLASLCTALDPAAVILGGDLGATGGPFVDGVRESIDRVAQPRTGPGVRVGPAKLGRRAELVGALTLAATQLSGAVLASGTSPAADRDARSLSARRADQRPPGG